MTKLSITLPFHDDESVVSFCSRLAAANGIRSAREFSLHMGFKFQQIVDGHPDAITELAYLSGADQHALSRRALVKAGGYFVLDGERFTKANVIRNRARFCPHCVADDARNALGPPEARPYGRLAWLMAPLRTCRVHHIYLLEHVSPTNGGIANDFLVLLDRALENGVGPELEAPESAFEQYLANRLINRDTPNTWIDGLAIQVVSRLSPIIGASLANGHKSSTYGFSTQQWLKSSESGFAVLAAGKDSFVDFIKSHHEQFHQCRTPIGNRELYGRLYRFLSYENDDSDFDVIREIIRETAVDCLPLGPGDDIFGPLTRRRWHSICSAANAMRIHPRKLRNILSSVGEIGDESRGLTDHRVIVDATRMEDLIAKHGDGLSYDEARAYINTTISSWKALLKDGHVRPFVAANDAASPAHRFAKSELDGFLDSLFSRVTLHHDPDDPDKLDILSARRRCQRPQRDVLDLLSSGQLSHVSRDPHAVGLMSVRVSLIELKAKVRLPDMIGLSYRQVQEALHVSFGVLKALLNGGHIAASEERNPISNLRQVVVARAEVDRFLGEYTSLYQLSNTHGKVAKTMAKHLREAAIEPAITAKEVGSTFYRVTDVKNLKVPG
jgi:hypothetical protein